MKHIRIFETVDAFNAAKDSLAKPNIGLIEATGKPYSISAEPEVDYSKVAMYFENVDTQDVTISVNTNGQTSFRNQLETSTDGNTWERWSYNFPESWPTKSVPVGGKLYVRTRSKTGYFITVINNNYYYNYFTSDGKVSVGGNIMSLGYKDFEDKTNISQEYAYEHVFHNMANLVDASKLVLPATELAEYCYSDMFSGCTGLTTAPELPATTLARYCYYNMFNGCTGLTTAPDVLPATTLASYCYYSMFSGCTSLTEAPELPATELVDGCYYYMFQGCSNLNYIKAMFTTTPSSSYIGSLDGDTYQWVDGVSSTGTFVKNASATWDVRGVNGIPEGWDVETATAE